MFIYFYIYLFNIYTYTYIDTYIFLVNLKKIRKWKYTVYFVFDISFLIHVFVKYVLLYFYIFVYLHIYLFKYLIS